MSPLYIGLMSGTSLDGVDTVLVEFAEDTPSCIATHTEPYPASLRDALLTLCEPDAKVETMMALDRRLGEFYARQIRQLLAAAGVSPTRVKAIGSHGQTIRHLPDHPYPTTLQIGDPNTIAQRTGITTVADFRRRDMAAGGEGAPLVPAFHRAVFHRPGENRVVVNIGGISNITILPGDSDAAASGFDCGPGNVLLDSWAALHLQMPMDKGGAWAASGSVDEELLARMLRDPYFRTSPPKSTGRERFNLQWLQAHGRIDSAPPADIAATLCELTASCIATAIGHHAPQTTSILVCGGGIHNKTMMERLRHLTAPCPVSSTKDHGIDPDWVEATAFAWLAKRTLEGKPGNLPAVTGAQEAVVLGAIYP